MTTSAPTFTKAEQMVIDAIRADAVVGRGTCTTIDEAFTDAELIEELRDRGKRLPGCAFAVKYFRELETRRAEHEAEMAGAW